MWIAFRDLILPVLSTLAPNWGYDDVTGPDHWQDTFPACGGRNQSPINIVTANTTGHFNWSPIGFKRYDALPSYLTLVNNGPTVHMVAELPVQASVQGEALGGKYTFDHINFHWGSNDSIGSEHMVDGRSYPLELQMVHFKSQYGSLAEALMKHDGLAILAVFVEVSPEDNHKVNNLVEGLASIIEPDTKTQLKPFRLQDLLPSNTTQFYKYQGSLTTPPCNEHVPWIIFKTPLKMSSAQLQKFRELRNNSGSPMVDNFRPIQPLHERSVFTGTDKPHWSYGDDDADRWERYYKLCAGLSQSPIDIMTNSTVNVTSWEKFYFDNYNVTPAEISITNNGHTALVSIATNLPPTVYGGNLEAGYRFMQFHFHWGANDSMGSEHTLNSRRFPNELHIVNFKAEYGSPKEAAKHADGIAVLGVLMELDDHDNVKLESIISGLDNITVEGHSTNIAPFPLEDLLPENVDEFYRYKGSLTTPTCNEVVTWTVFKQPVTISKTQVSKFHNLEDQRGHKIVKTFRPVKPLNGRVVHFAKLD